MDRAYDTNEILSYLNRQNIKPVIPPKRNGLPHRDYDRILSSFCNIIENAFIALQRWSCTINEMYRTLLIK